MKICECMWRSSSEVAFRGRRLRRRAGHMHEFPGVAVEVFIAMRVHEAVILGLAWHLGATGARVRHELIHLLAAAAGHARQHFSRFAGVRDALVSKGSEETLHEQHHVQVVTENHAGPFLVGERGIERVAKLGEEIHGALEVSDREIDENLRVHDEFLGRSS